MKRDDINEEIIDLKKTPRSESKAMDLATGTPVENFNPLQLLVKLHKNGKVAAKNALKKELGKQKDIGEDAVIKFRNSCIESGKKYV